MYNRMSTIRQCTIGGGATVDVRDPDSTAVVVVPVALLSCVFASLPVTPNGIL